MGVVTWIAIGVIVLVAIGLGVGVFFSGLVRGAQIVAQNPVVKNATTETGKALSNTSVTTLYAATAVQPEKNTYTSSEPIVIIVKNQGTQTIAFPSHASTLKVKNQANGNEYSVSGAMDKNQLAPGESLKITWDQRDSNGNLVGSGTYTVTVQQGSDNVGTTTVTMQ